MTATNESAPTSLSVLVIHQHAGGPAWGMVDRPFEMARSWVQLGHKVTVAAGVPSPYRGVEPVMHGDVCGEEIDGVRMRWYASPLKGSGAWAERRHAKAFERALRADMERLLADVAPDVVVVASPLGLDIDVGKAIAQRARALLVADRCELPNLYVRQMQGVSPWHPLRWAVLRAERTTCHAVDLMFCEVAKSHPYWRSRGLDLRKLHVIPSAVPMRPWDDAAARTPIREDVVQAIGRARSKGYTVVGYSGPLGRADDLSQLLDAAVLLKQERFAFVIVGDGPERESLAEGARSRGLSTVIVMPGVAPSQWAALHASFDFVFIARRAARMNAFGAPNPALAQAMAAGQAVVHASNAAGDMVRELDCGVSVVPGDARSGARAIRQLAQASRRDRMDMGARGVEHARQHWSYDVVAARALDLIVAELGRWAPRVSAAAPTGVAAAAVMSAMAVEGVDAMRDGPVSRTPPLGVDSLSDPDSVRSQVQ